MDRVMLSGRFAELLRSNEPPLDVEVALLEPLIADSQSNLADVKSLIASAERNLAELREECVRLEGIVSQQKAVLHPLRRLPGDVLVEIFTIVKQMDWKSTCDYEIWDICCGILSSQPHLTLDKAPWSLSYVCSRWRSLSLAMPLLWRNVIANFSSPLKRGITLLLGLQLQRSGNVPLDVTLEHLPVFKANDNIHPALAILVQHASRWRRLIVTVPNVDALDVLGQTIPFLPSLRFLNISCRDSGSVVNPNSFSNVFAFSPGLQEVKLTRIENPYALCLPWSQIRTSMLDQVSYFEPSVDIFRILQQSSQLERVTFWDLCLGTPPDQPEDSTITLPLVREIEFSDCSVQELTRVFRILVVPKLENLLVDQISDDQPFADASVLSPFIHGPYTPLRILNIELRVACRKLSDILRRTPSLVELRVRLCEEISSEFLEDLLFNPQRQSSPLVPNLTRLEFSGSPEFDDDLMIRMIESRCQGSTTGRIQSLKKVELYLGIFSSDDEPNTIECYDQLSPFRIYNGGTLDLQLDWELVD
ncbi:hypothetical protein VKT23_013827 [Stygiomarasmius scandens]|uniref:F-box domain-containing protein n=1 Tax=Marasmiellus scandens TaxID=2682957 RepID=A0ABR1J2B7_9AGAR